MSIQSLRKIRRGPIPKRKIAPGLHECWRRTRRNEGSAKTRHELRSLRIFGIVPVLDTVADPPGGGRSLPSWTSRSVSLLIYGYGAARRWRVMSNEDQTGRARRPVSPAAQPTRRALVRGRALGLHANHPQRRGLGPVLLPGRSVAARGEPFRLGVSGEDREPGARNRCSCCAAPGRSPTRAAAPSTCTAPGVVGEQPLLEPGECFEYTSGTPLDTPSGFMVGAYHMVVPVLRREFRRRDPGIQPGQSASKRQGALTATRWVAG